MAKQDHRVQYCFYKKMDECGCRELLGMRFAHIAKPNIKNIQDQMECFIENEKEFLGESEFVVVIRYTPKVMQRMFFYKENTVPYIVDKWIYFDTKETIINPLLRNAQAFIYFTTKKDETRVETDIEEKGYADIEAFRGYIEKSLEQILTGFINCDQVKILFVLDNGWEYSNIYEVHRERKGGFIYVTLRSKLKIIQAINDLAKDFFQKEISKFDYQSKPVNERVPYDFIIKLEDEDISTL